MRLIDANALKEEFPKDEDWEYPVNTNQLVCETIDVQPTIDAVPLDGSFLKMSKGDYLIYNRHWLYEHFDMEMEIQRSVMKSMGYEPALKDAEPVRHGKWKWLSCTYDRVPREKEYECSECHHKTIVHGDDMPWERYCPNCGARMDKE